MVKNKTKAPKKCPHGAHNYAPTCDPRYQKCYFCTSIQYNKNYSPPKTLKKVAPSPADVLEYLRSKKIL